MEEYNGTSSAIWRQCKRYSQERDRSTTENLKWSILRGETGGNSMRTRIIKKKKKNQWMSSVYEHVWNGENELLKRIAEAMGDQMRNW